MAEPRPRARRAPAATPEASENRMISLATKLAEQQLEAGTASAQVITHFLRLGSIREELERDKIRHETALLEAKRESLAAGSEFQQQLAEALTAFRSYAGEPDVSFDEG